MGEEKYKPREQASDGYSAIHASTFGYKIGNSRPIEGALVYQNKSADHRTRVPCYGMICHLNKTLVGFRMGPRRNGSGVFVIGL